MDEFFHSTSVTVVHATFHDSKTNEWTQRWIACILQRTTKLFLKTKTHFHNTRLRYSILDSDDKKDKKNLVHFESVLISTLFFGQLLPQHYNATTEFKFQYISKYTYFIKTVSQNSTFRLF